MNLQITITLTPDQVAGLQNAAGTQSPAAYAESRFVEMLNSWDMDRRRKVAYALAEQSLALPKAVRDTLADQVGAALKS